ncbi:Fe-S-containing hydro-lyase [Anaerobranca gottschalkii]|uniref:Fumarate hydratase subunit beta n=1 Tax=Anaerobranca gottschalkii DSM 13577 TaxID=1120990 RepID=A0A1I0AGC7_9FIRM|nr:Fe-S-containing hydro-lyase [Anaerobranca gottschalkii]SES93191.1 fumarate hydratase subunit beta [Anaerobranca gottschalkii DSM 13577]
MERKKIKTPLSPQDIESLVAGDLVELTGVIYTARDAAHKRMIEALNNGEQLPFDLNGNVIYYVGPTPAKEGQVIGSAGPTTSGRMDKYTPRLLDLGLKGMIGKGLRSQEVVESIKKNKGVYFAAVGGAAALISKRIIKSEIIAYEDLGTEGIRKLEVVDFPVIVAIDSQGNNFYEIGQQKYLQSK